MLKMLSKSSGWIDCKACTTRHSLKVMRSVQVQKIIPKVALIKKTKSNAGEWQDAFIAVLRGSGNIRHSCEQAGISRKTAYQWKKQDKTFSEKWKDAKEDAIEMLEYEARVRAMESSDVLLMFLLKALKPEKYRERYEHRIPEGEREHVVIYLPDNGTGKGKGLPKESDVKF